MDRMTEKGPDGYYIPAERGTFGVEVDQYGKIDGTRFTGSVVDRLGEYEDSVGDPQVTRILKEMLLSDAAEIRSLRGECEKVRKQYYGLMHELCVGDEGEHLLELNEVIDLAKAKKEGRCIIMDSPINGTAEVLVDGKLEKRRVTRVTILQNELPSCVSFLVEKADKQKGYPDCILRCLRQRWGMTPDDTSRDEIFQSMEPHRVLEEVLSWNGLIGGWSGQIIGWIKDIYGIDLEG